MYKSNCFLLSSNECLADTHLSLLQLDLYIRTLIDASGICICTYSHLFGLLASGFVDLDTIWGLGKLDLYIRTLI